MTDPNFRPAHWDRAYERPADAVSWYQPSAQTSLELISAAEISTEQPIVDVGGGASTLVDGLIEHGYRDITVLDVAQKSLDVARERLGAGAQAVSWVVADITTWQPGRAYGCWHDRAVFHFLTEAADRDAYRRCLARAVEPGGSIIIGTFAEDGPERCSGLPVRRYSAQQLEDEFRQVARLAESRHEQHRTPSGGSQSFVFARMVRT
jgi:ubiquinone/menaquinone biosynthesis C-methylase UbiE